MSWIKPEPYDDDLFSALDLNAAFGHLCMILSPALRIEPRLLRNARQRFLPRTDAGLENRFWFSRVVGSRSARSVSLRPGLARRLIDHLANHDGARGSERLAKICAFITEQTRDWDELDRLEQSLRWAIRADDQPQIGDLLHDLLRRIGTSSEERERIDLARWIKGALSPLQDATKSYHESGWLAQFAGAILGDTGLVLHGTITRLDPMPDWLSSLLPTSAGLSLGLRMGRDGDRLILECVAPEPRWPRLDLLTPAPTPVHIAYENQAELSPGWMPLFLGCRIPVTRRCQALILQTLDGRRFRLMVGTPSEATSPGFSQPSQVTLVHALGDEAQARRIAALLEQQSIRVRVEQHIPLVKGAPERMIVDTEASIVVLWSKHAAKALEIDSEWIRRALFTVPSNQNYHHLVILDKTPLPEDLGTLGSELAQVDLSEASDEWGLKKAQKLLAALSVEQGDKPYVLRPEDLKQPRPFVHKEAASEAKELPKLEMERLLAELGNSETLPEDRLEIGNRLAEWSNSQSGVGLDEKGLPDIDWVEIPARTFLYGESEKTQELPVFFIARYPITNAQYQTFINAKGYQDTRWWRGLAHPRYIKKPAPSRWPLPNRPRTNVSWYEAVAFCCWLSAQRGYEIRLPTECEWEKGARGTDGREYPWGDDYRSGLANVNERWSKVGPHYLEQTSAVGLYPQGASPYGVLDMAGNVWEWCLNEFSIPENIQLAGQQARVVRGGSWFDNSADARSAARGYNAPDSRFDDFGFRVLCSSPIE